MNTYESPRDADQENTDDTAVPRTETFSTALPATHRFDAAPSFADEALGAPGAGKAPSVDDAGEPPHSAPFAAATAPAPDAAPYVAPAAAPLTAPAAPAAVAPEERRGGPRVSTIVWGLLIMALAGLLIVSRLGIVALDGTYVLIGLMIGTGAALVLGGLVAAAARKNPAGRGTDHRRTPGNGSGIA
ncbi:hypothetical protein QFZ52_002355 [Arthrobacter woluwensis]|uniref:hypothetical protein n=1 Tax=Arthrobacter woluwensis TaxID=156980 RepID=UPI0027807717|nr:hypothetical protein [Arthrobacter woluwensis]MDQ0709703.1 hypothetical protein [Arthrobacter woluwensis]